uniref:Ferritin n=1 Tax=Physcomitrium patens TaxID=3218 RepID=A0A7I4A2I2_PHYPA|nr:ferritin-3, chloroplastic-like isoform X2 [Physcomitrium patens]|eukprot:XP_024385820.1 ferritin-3, chloroplastic-like isoform X2 [Physcomitrella patens]
MVMARAVVAGSVNTSAGAVLATRSGDQGSLSASCKSVVVRSRSLVSQSRVVAVRASGQEFATKTLSGVVFEPFSEVQDQLVKVTTSPQLESLARQRFAPSCEAAINDQIKYFKHASDEEREHAEKLMRYQNQRGGKVKLQSIVMPLMEFDHHEKGDALYAMELALALEKLTNEKLFQLHQAAADANDHQMTEFIEREFLTEQVEAIKKVSEYVSQLRRVGQGHGVYHFDLQLQEA